MSAEPAPHHPTSPRTYYVVFAALILLTASTAIAAVVPLKDWGLEAWHTPIGMAIAAIKATLIVLIFMHGLESGRLVWMVIAVALLCLAIMFAFTFSDYATARPGRRGARSRQPAVAGRARGIAGKPT